MGNGLFERRVEIAGVFDSPAFQPIGGRDGGVIGPGEIHVVVSRTLVGFLAGFDPSEIRVRDDNERNVTQNYKLSQARSGVQE